MSALQIILQKNVTNLGLVGDVVKVAPGYYRNYLAPRQLAMLANPGSIKQATHQKKLIEAQKEKQKVAALELKTKMESLIVSLSHAAGSGDKLFGAITTQEIFVAIKKMGFEIDRKQIKLESPIKTLGEHGIEIKLHPEVVAKIKVGVIRKTEEFKKEEKSAE